MGYPLSTFGERVWYAYLCLPRKRGKPPAAFSLENYIKNGVQQGRDDGPSFGTFSKLFKGIKVEPRRETKEKIALVLGVPIRWLDYGDGDPPSLTGPYRRMPLDEALRQHDVAELVGKYEAIGGPDAEPNNFRIAVLFYRAELDRRAIEDVARVAAGHENDVEPREWARQLRVAHHRHTGLAFDLALPSQLPGVPPKTRTKPPRKRRAS